MGLSGLGYVPEPRGKKSSDAVNSSSSGPRPKSSRTVAMFSLPETE